MFPPEQSREIVNALIASRIPVSYCNVQSACGHDAFLLPDDFPIYGEMIRVFLRNLTGDGVRQNEADDEESHGPTSIFHQHRLDYERIVELPPAGASVLDLGCGSGALLARLKVQNHRHLVGVELDERKILTCVSRGLDVVQARPEQRAGRICGRGV